MMDSVLEIRNLCKGFSGFALRGISFTLPKGYIMGLVGPNGAGKTTMIQLILNMLEKDTGEILVFGWDNLEKASQIKQEIGIVFDSTFYVDNWTVRDTEKAVSIFYEDWRHEIFREMTERFSLPWNKKVRELSRGMQMKLMLACALSHNARLLILDEPTSGLDPAARDELLEILQDYIRDGERSVLLSTHITTDLEKIADYITFILQGELFYTGGLEDLLGSFRLIKGKPEDLTADMKKSLIGSRKTGLGFEGLIRTEEIEKYKNYMIDVPTIDDIVIHASKGGEKK